MFENSDISKVVNILISSVYPELQSSNLVVSWGKTSSYAQIIWDDMYNEISILVNKSVKTWHEAGIIGLVSHELSHPAQKWTGLSELKTDRDSISRGLGPYLATERLYTGKYEDHLINRGKDRYLGYRSIRSQLTQLESQQLDLLLQYIGMLPANTRNLSAISHDIAIFDNQTTSTILVDGHEFLIPKDLCNSDIKLVERNFITYVYADEILIGEFEECSK